MRTILTFLKTITFLCYPAASPLPPVFFTGLFLTIYSPFLPLQPEVAARSLLTSFRSVLPLRHFPPPRPSMAPILGAPFRIRPKGASPAI